MSSAGARPVVVAALCVSVVLAVAKLLAVLQSSTSALLASTVHSLIDASCLGLVFLGLSNASAAASGPQQNRTQSRALHFWSFVVAIPLYAMGGGVSLYEGVERIARPQPLVAPASDMLTLAVAAAGWALVALMAMREFRAAGASTDPLQAAIDQPDVAPTITVIVVAVAALAGNGLALGGLLGAANGGDPRSDAFAALAVGMAMSAVAAFMAIEVKRLLAAAPMVVPGSAIGPAPGSAGNSQPGPPSAEPAVQLPASAVAAVPAKETASVKPITAPSQSGSTAKPPVTARQSERKGRGKRRR